MPKKGSASSSTEVSETSFWNALKRSDANTLAEMLLDRVEDAETGEVSFRPRPHAAALVNRANAKKLLPLSYAISQGAEEAVLHTLLRAGAKADARDGTKEQSPALHTACWGEDDIATQLLLRCGASPLVTDAEGRTSLHVLAALNASHLFAYVLEAATTRTERRNGLRYLDGHPPVVVDALELLGKRDIAGFTVLHTAVSEVSGGSDTVITELLDFVETRAATCPAEVQRFVNQLTETRSSALHLLLSSPNCPEGMVLNILDRILKLGADPTILDEWGQTPLMVAVATQTSAATAGAVVRSLLIAVQKQPIEDDTCDHRLEPLFTQRDTKKGYALIHHAIAARNSEAVSSLLASLQHVDATRRRAWLGEAHTSEGVSVAVMLASRQCEEVSRLLLNAGVVEAAVYATCVKAAEEERLARAFMEADAAAKEAEAHAEEAEKSTGDFSGFGAAQVGSRVQQARKAKAQAAQKRRQAGKAEAEAEKEDSSLCMKVAGLLLVLSMVLGAVTMMLEKTRQG